MGTTVPESARSCRVYSGIWTNDGRSFGDDVLYFSMACS
jgi:hypothetical protein